MLRITLLILFAVSAGGLYFVLSDSSTEQSTLTVGGARLTVEIADELQEQIQGLSGRPSLCPDCGMLFVYSRPAILSVWMKDMKFPLDIIFIREGKISEIYENLPVPETGKAIPAIWSQQEAEMFLEVNAGFVQAHGLKKGDAIGLN